MSPFSPVTTRRWVLVALILAMPALPIAAWMISSAVSDNASFVEAIQQSRRESTLSSCREQNQRHDDTLDGVDFLTLQRIAGDDAVHGLTPDEVRSRLGSAVAALPPAQRVQVQQARRNTAYLIDRLAPRRDCEARVRDLVTLDQKP